MPKIFSESPISISYSDTLDYLRSKYNRYQHIIYTCKECSNQENAVLNYIKDLNFLCKSCNRKRSLIEKYGSLEAANNAILQKRKETNKLKFGVEYPLQNKNCKEKAKNTCKEHFGVDSPMHSSIIKEKQKNTLLERYGVTNCAYIPEIRRSRTKYNIDLDEDLLDPQLFYMLGNPIKKLSETNNVCGIYKITNLINNKKYIGSSKNIGNRWHSHRNSCLWEKLNFGLYKDFINYGLDKFRFDVIEICNERELLDREQYWILLLNPEYNKKLAISDRKSNTESAKNAISGVYMLLNNITGNFYIGSSKNIVERQKQHFTSSTTNMPYSNKVLYEDIHKYGKDNFTFIILEECSNIKEVEQQYIDYLCPSYNIGIAKAYNNKQSRYYIDNKEKITKYKKDYYNHTCIYNGEKISFRALARQFTKLGIPRPYSTAKKYIEDKNGNKN